MKAVIQIDGSPLNFVLDGTPEEILEFTQLSAKVAAPKPGTRVMGAKNAKSFALGPEYGRKDPE